MKDSRIKKRYFGIDLIKALAIISVILIHCISLKTRNNILGPFHILQAVPLFMMVSGFNFANSYKKQEINFSEYYSLNNILKKMKRLLLPVLVVYILEIILLSIKNGFNWRSLIVELGPGSYYIVLMVVLTLVIPYIYVGVKKYLSLFIVITVFVSLGIEFLMYYFNVSNSIYRLSLFRFILPVVLGLYYGIIRVKLNIKWFVLGIISFIYITGTEYFSWPTFSQPDWRSQNTLAFFYAFIIFCILFKVNFNNKIKDIIIIISQATYHIFLVQMVYFKFGLNHLVASRLLSVVISLIVCIGVGLLFYFCEKKVLKYIGERL